MASLLKDEANASSDSFLDNEQRTPRSNTCENNNVKVQDCNSRMKHFRELLRELELEVTLISGSSLSQNDVEASIPNESIDSQSTIERADVKLLNELMHTLKRNKVKQLATDAANSDLLSQLRKQLIKSDRKYRQVLNRLDAVTSNYKALLANGRDINEKIDQLSASFSEIQQDCGSEAPTELPQHLQRLKSVSQKLQTIITSAGQVAAILYQSSILTREEHELVTNGSKAPTEAAKQLIDILLREKKTEAHYECFLDALKQTRNEAAYSILKLGEIGDERHEAVIREHYLFLLDTIDPKFTNLIRKLYEFEVIDRREEEDLEMEKSAIRRNERLLSLICCKSQGQFDMFLLALRETGQRHVANRLCGDDGSDSAAGSTEICSNESNDVDEMSSLICKLRSDAEEREKVVNEQTISIQSLQAELLQVKQLFAGYEDSLKETNERSCKQLSDLEQKLNEVTAEKDRYKLLLDIELTRLEELRRRSDLKLIRCLPQKYPVTGIAILDNEVFVKHSKRAYIVVYDTADSSSIKRYLYVPEMGSIVDMASCGKYGCIYISDCKNQVIHRVEVRTNDTRVEKWTVDDKPCGLSVNADHDVVVTCRASSKIKMFTTHGTFLTAIDLLEAVHPQHAIQLTRDKFIVCHGSTNLHAADDPLQRVCIIDRNGIVQHSFGDNPGADESHVNIPERLAVVKGMIFVVDLNNRRVLVLSPTLRYIRSFASGINGFARNILFDEQDGRLYLAENTLVNGVYRDGFVNVFNVG